MPILGYDIVVKCKLCKATAHARVPQAEARTPVDPMDIMAQLSNEGFESDGGDDFLCWQHGKRWRRRADGRVPNLQRENKV